MESVPANWFIQLNFTFWWSLFLIRPHSGISKSSWLQTIINLASSIILSLSSLSECTQKYSQKMHQKPWVLSVIHSNTKNTHHLKLVFNSTANLDIHQLWFLIVESFCYSIILSSIQVSAAKKIQIHRQYQPQTDKLINNYLKVYLRKKYHNCMGNPNFICKFCIFIKNIFNSNPYKCKYTKKNRIIIC